MSVLAREYDRLTAVRRAAEKDFTQSAPTSLLAVPPTYTSQLVLTPDVCCGIINSVLTIIMEGLYSYLTFD
jgi:hypothetical protein